MMREIYQDSIPTPFFQPIVDYTTGKTIAYEVLSRWLHEGKWLSPSADFNLNNDVDSEMLHLSILMKKVQEEIISHPHFFSDIKYISFNLNINNADLRVVACCRDIIRSGYTGKIVIELNEAQEILESPVVSMLLSELNKLGVIIALDDFGKGYLSFAAILKFNTGILKIDKSLTLKISDSKAKIIIENISTMAKQLNLLIIAEGVESHEIAEDLRGVNVSLMQGYFFGKPNIL